MSTAMQVFDYESNEVRIVDHNGKPWLVLTDVCRAIDHTNPTMAVQMLDPDERSKLSLGRQGETNIISESGLYHLLICSNLPKATPFRLWVTSVVLPSVINTGSYSMTPQPKSYKLSGMASKALNDAREAYLRDFPHLSSTSKQLVHNEFGRLMGATLPTPVLDSQLYDATTAAKLLGIEKYWMTRDARYQGLRPTDETDPRAATNPYGQFLAYAKTTADTRHEGSNWNWNARGLAELRQIFADTPPCYETSAKYKSGRVVQFDPEDPNRQGFRPAG